MADIGDFFGLSIETQNTNSIFRGLSIEYEINLIISVYSSEGVLIDDACSIEIFDASDDTLLNSGNTSGGVFGVSVFEPTAIKAVAIHDIEGRISRSIVHDGESIINLTLSFVPSVLTFHEANPIRTVIIDSPLLDTENKLNAFQEDQPDPLFIGDRYYQPFLKKDQIDLQFWSSYEQNTVQIFDLSNVANGDVINPLKVVDLDAAYDVYEYYIDLANLAVGNAYYLKFTGDDDAQGSYEVRSENFIIKGTDSGLAKIEYSNNDNSYNVDHAAAGISFMLRFHGEFWRTQYRGDSTVFTDDSYQLKKLSAVKRKHGLLKIHGVPHWMLDKINLALDHDVVKINNQEVVFEGNIEAEIEEDLTLVKGDEWLPFKEAFVNRFE